MPKRNLIWLLAVLPALPGCSPESLFFYPDSAIRGTPADAGLAYEEVHFPSRDGTQLTGWFIPATGEPLGTVIHLHGNAENMSSHFAYVSWLPRAGFNLFMFDYRGYGTSAGTPTIKGVMEDSAAAIEYVRSRADIGPRRFIVFGQSLGGANALLALKLVGGQDVVGVAVESAFSSYAGVAEDKMPLLGGSLIRGHDEPADAIGSIAPVPVLIIHGTADTVVPFRHARILFDAAREPRELWALDGAGHTAALGARRAEYQPRLGNLFRKWASRDTVKTAGK